jgi:hypothetical protein
MATLALSEEDQIDNGQAPDRAWVLAAAAAWPAMTGF